MTRDTIRRAVRTFLQAFAAILIPGSLGWLNGLTEWARSEGQTPFPDSRSLAFVGVAAIVAGAVALVSFLQNVIEDGIGSGILRTVPPKAPDRPDTGRTDVLYALVCVLVIVVILVILF